MKGKNGIFIEVQNTFISLLAGNPVLSLSITYKKQKACSCTKIYVLIRIHLYSIQLLARLINHVSGQDQDLSKLF